MRLSWFCDCTARLLFPLPDTLYKLIAPQIMACFVFGIELPFNHHLSGDAGMIGTRLPKRIFSTHTVYNELVHP